MTRRGRRLDPFVPSPMDVVEEMIEFASPREGAVLVDLGSGDGRIPIVAARLAGCRAFGVEINPRLVEIARGKRDRELGREAGRVEFLNVDASTLDLSSADVITTYLTSRALSSLSHVLATARPDAVIITHDYQIRGWRPVEVLEKRSSFDGKVHVLYKYIPAYSRPNFLSTTEAAAASSTARPTLLNNVTSISSVLPGLRPAAISPISPYIRSLSIRPSAIGIKRSPASARHESL